MPTVLFSHHWSKGISQGTMPGDRQKQHTVRFELALHLPGISAGY